MISESDNRLSSNQETNHFVVPDQDEHQDEPAFEDADQLASVEGVGVGRNVNLVVLQDRADEEVRRAPADKGGDRDGFGPHDVRGEPSRCGPAKPTDTEPRRNRNHQDVQELVNGIRPHILVPDIGLAHIGNEMRHADCQRHVPEARVPDGCPG